MTDNKQERIDRCHNCKYCIRLCEYYGNSAIYCDCKKFKYKDIDPVLLITCKYHKQRKNKQKVLK